MEIKKANDIFVATLNNPNATPYDLMKLSISPDNTSLYTKDEYKQTKLVKDNFTKEDGTFDDLAFDEFYTKAKTNFEILSDDKYISDLDKIQYSPFDYTRQKDSGIFSVDVQYTKDFNPFKQLYSRTSVNSITESPLSLREIAQKGKVYDYDNDEWLENSANDVGFFKKLFGNTLVYAQWDEDGTHKDVLSGKIISHKKGDWKINEDGELFTEKLGNREVYGKQVVNPMDLLTTDGSVANKFDLFDRDNKESSISKTVLGLAVDIAPLLIPGFNKKYAAVKAAVGLSSVLPTFYKSFEGILLGDEKTESTEIATAAENYMAKFKGKSLTDEAQGKTFSFESIAQMTSDIFSQIYEQRAAASLANLFYKPDLKALASQQAKYYKMVGESGDDVLSKLAQRSFKNPEEAKKLVSDVINALPGTKDLFLKQSGMSKALSLGYMALTTTGDIYGEAIEGGFDRRTAGFAALMAASGQYGIMMNNRMGDWFLDKTTGYSIGTNKALINKTIKEYLPAVQKAMGKIPSESKVAKASLASIYKNFKTKINDVFVNPSIIGEELFKNAIVEGVEEFTEEVVLDATKGIIDTLSYLGLTKNKGSFNTVEEVFSKQGLEKYLASILGGFLGGAMFEFHRSKIEPWINREQLSAPVKENLYKLIANGETENLIKAVNKYRSSLGNNYISPNYTGDVSGEANKGQSEADIIADITIQKIKNIEGLMKNNNLIKDDKEILRNALLNNLTILNLEENKSSEIGLEGMIVDDFRKNSLAITDILQELNKLGDEESDYKTRLKEDLKVFQNFNKKIIDGELAGEYFEKLTFALNPIVNDVFLTVDRNSYSKNVYNKNYFDLPDSGVGITKQKIDEEWNDYLNNKNLKRDINIAWNAYKELEKEFNPSLVDFSSRYLEFRKNTIENNIINMNKIMETFNPDDPKSIENFKLISKEIEDLTGERVLPWDIYKNDFVNSAISNDMFLSSTQNVKSELNKEINGKKVIDIITDQLDNILSKMPADNTIYSFVSQAFNQNIENYNSKILDKINSLDPSNTEEINSLKNQIIDLNLKTVEDTDEYKNLNNDFNNKIKTIINNEGLSEEILPLISNNSMVFSVLDLVKQMQNLDLTDEKKLELLKQVKNNPLLFQLFKSTPFIGLFDNLNISDFDIILEEILKFENKLNNIFLQVNEINSEYSDNLTNLLNSLKGMFKIKDYTLDVILSEIKNGNLDKELLNTIKQKLSKIINNIKSEFTSLSNLSEKEIVDFITNYDQIQNTISLVVDDLFNQEFDENHIITKGDFENVLGKNNIPDFLFEFVNFLENRNLTLNELDGISSSLHQFIMESESNEIYKNYIENIEKISEIIPDENSFISNSIYDFLNNFQVILGDGSTKETKTVFDILKEEELRLLTASDISSYLSEKNKDNNLISAINTLKLLKSIVYGAMSTKIEGFPISGFIDIRKDFYNKNKISGDILNLSSIESFTGQYVIQEIERIENKLSFLRELAKSNSTKAFTEQEKIRTNNSELLVSEFKKLTKKNFVYNQKPVIPDLSEILDKDISYEQKLLEIKTAIFNQNKDLNIDDKINIISQLIKEYPFNTVYEEFKSLDSENKEISNHMFISQIMISLSMNSKDYNHKYKNLLTTDTKKAPFYTQELAIELAYAAILNKKLFSEIAKLTADPRTMDASLITFLLGGSGTGKTSTIIPTIINLLKSENPNMSIWETASGERQVQTLKKSIEFGVDISKMDVKTFTKNNLFKLLGLEDTLNLMLNDIKSKEDLSDKSNIIYSEENDGYVVYKFGSGLDLSLKNEVSLPNLILIDEVTHFNAVELTLLNEYLKTLDNPPVILAAGDPTQKGATLSMFDEHSSKPQVLSFNVERVHGIFSVPLNVSIRSANVQKRGNNDMFYGIVSYVNKHYTSSDNLKQILSFVEDKLIFRSHLSKRSFNGDFILNTSELKSDIDIIKPYLETIKNNLSLPENINKTVGVMLSSESEVFKNTISSVLEGFEDRIIFFTPDSVQGDETNYFIFDTNLLNKEENIAHSLRALYTYITRAKEGSIVINNYKDSYLNNLSSLSESTTEEIEPLSESVIKEAITKRLEVLNTQLSGSLLGNDANYKFNSESEKSSDKLSLTDPESLDIEGDDISTEVVEEGKLTFYSFYNDLNVEIEDNGDSITIFHKPNSLNSGLSFLNDQSEIDKKEYTSLLNQLSSLKYSVLSKLNDLDDLKNYLNNNVTFKTISNNNSILNLDLVIVKQNYSNANKPVAKLGDVVNKHLDIKSKYVSLYLKVELEGQKPYYIHLSAGPNIKTIDERIEFHSANDNKKAVDFFKSIRDKYKEFLNSDIIETTVDNSLINISTSTRLLKRKDSGKLNLHQIKNIPGITFYNLSESGLNIDLEKEIKLYPSDLNSFEKIINIGRSVPFSEEQINTHFKNLKGRPYVIIGFGNNPDKIKPKVLTLKQNTTSLKDLKSKTLEAMVKLKNNEKVDTETYLTPNQVLNMLVDLRIDKPDVYNKLFTVSSSNIIKNIPEDLALKLKDYISSVESVLKKDLISYITYETNNKDSKESRSVLRDIITYINTQGNSFKTKEELKENVLSNVKLKKYWSNYFWNVFTASNRLDKIILSTSEDSIKEHLSDLQNTLSEAFLYWEENSLKQGVYYNVPIKDTGIPKQIEENNLNLYTNLLPEGPELLIDFNKLLSEVSTQSVSDKPITNINTKDDIEEKIDSISNDTLNEVIEPKVEIEKEFTLPEILNRIEFYKDSPISEKIEGINFYLNEIDKNIELEGFQDKIKTIENNWSKFESLLNSKVFYYGEQYNFIDLPDAILSEIFNSLNYSDSNLILDNTLKNLIETNKDNLLLSDENSFLNSLINLVLTGNNTEILNC